MNLALGLISREAGGAEFQACLLANGLIKRGHNVILYCTDPTVSAPMLQQFPGLPARVLRPGIGTPRARYLWQALQLRRWYARDRIDAAVGFLGMPHGLLSAAALGTRVRIYGRRSCVWSECNGYGAYDAYVPRLQGWVKRWGWRTTALVCNAPAVVESARTVEGWPAAKLIAIPNGWPEYPMTDGASAVPVYVARPRPEKAVDRATQAFAEAGVPLALQFDVPRWEDVGILVHASRADALSNAVGMAMAHGIPVAAFDLRGNEALLGKDRCVRRWNYEALADDVAGLRADRGRRLLYGGALRDRVRAEFSLKGMVDGWETLLSGRYHNTTY